MVIPDIPMVRDVADGRKVERVLMGEGRGATWLQADEDQELVYHRQEPMDFVARHDEDGAELERLYVRYIQRLVWEVEDGD